MQDLSNKVMLVTGGTGSFGSAFIKHIVKHFSPKRIRIYSRDEHKQAEMLENTEYGNSIDGFIGDVRDKDRLRRAVEGVDVIIHTAALKRVQSCEYNPFEAVKTNVFGSMNVIDCALDEGVDKLLIISTDKAVAPLNLYGATKMCMEKLAVQANSYRGTKKTKIFGVRYGNVAGAKGSVIPYWRKCLMDKTPIPINNSQATRFWFGMPEAVSFVTDILDLSDNLCGGEIFIPKIPSFKIMDLYHAMAEGKDFTVTGDRIGDKLHETLICGNEMTHSIDAGDKFIICPEEPRWAYTRPKGVPCGNRAGYSSDRNEWFFTVGEIKEKLASIP